MGTDKKSNDEFKAENEALKKSNDEFKAENEALKKSKNNIVAPGKKPDCFGKYSETYKKQGRVCRACKFAQDCKE